jgi:hypothetical protein
MMIISYIDTCSLFRQHFESSFYANFLATKSIMPNFKKAALLYKKLLIKCWKIKEESIVRLSHAFNCGVDSLKTTPQS